MNFLRPHEAYCPHKRTRHSTPNQTLREEISAWTPLGESLRLRRKLAQAIPGRPKKCTLRPSVTCRQKFAVGDHPLRWLKPQILPESLSLPYPVELCAGVPTPPQGLGYCPSAMRKELTPQQISSVPCPTCGVQPREKCQLNTGQPRNNPHRDRRLFAADQLNSRYNVNSQEQTSRHISITSGGQVDGF